jgi:hypothetical protein
MSARIPNPFGIVFRLIAWPFVALFLILMRLVPVQVWMLKKFAASGCSQDVLNQMAAAFNRINSERGTPAKFIVPDDVDKSQIDQGTKQNEAKS